MPEQWPDGYCMVYRTRYQSKELLLLVEKVRLAACEALTPINSENSLIVPIDISALTTPSNSEIKSMSSDIVIRIGSITLELSNNASATLIENTLRAIQNVR